MSEVLSDVAWDHTLCADGDDLLLSVHCGTVGTYDLCIRLSPFEAGKYRRLGIDGIRWLIADVQYRPHDYASRRCTEPR